MSWRDFWHLVAICALFCLCFCLGSCCPCRSIGNDTERTERDSTYQSKVDSIRIVIRDTMWLDRLEQSHDRVQTLRQYSHLDNRYCTSIAEVGDDGLLSHTLDTKDSALMPVRTVRVEHIVRDTVVRYKDRVQTEVKVKEVVRSAWYDRFIRVACIGLLAVVLIQNRKWIGKLIGLWRI